jgi:hypothetical protein
MTDTFVPVSIGDFTEAAHGTIGAHSLGDLTVAEVNASGQAIHRAQRHINRLPAEYFQFAVKGGPHGWREWRAARRDRPPFLPTPTGDTEDRAVTEGGPSYHRGSLGHT